ncbi:prephenate dehydrogenase [Thermoanaerobacterium sp. DL9XJH110]|uniref:prephenate dehydrogenase n=1 Tax=Thermoanaerobacterium sp. DL9XJH110 TaxID=3386643 RepID=UPI003BB6685F
MEIKKVAVMGLGLIGGSLAKAFNKMGVKVTGFDVDDETLALAKNDGVIDGSSGNIRDIKDEEKLKQALKDVNLVFLCVPVFDIAPVLRRVMNCIPKGAILTDTGSVKKSVIDAVEPFLAPGVTFIGGHPMAGSERSGYRWSRPDLFMGASYVITPTSSTGAEELWTLVQLVRDLGARPVLMSPEDHDLAVAAVSHLPQVISTTLVNTVKRVHPGGDVINVAGGGWRDTTRIAASGTRMWSDILIANKDRILPLIAAFKEELSILETAIENSDERGIEQFFNAAREYKNNTCNLTRRAALGMEV